MSKQQRKSSKRRARKTSTTNMEAGKNYELLKRYVRRSACSAAAGLGAFGLSDGSSEAAINVVDAPLFFSRNAKLTGQPFDPYGGFGWATTGFDYYYGGAYGAGAAFGIDIDGNGTGDFNAFRGFYYGGYIVAGTYYVGYYAGKVRGSDNVRMLNNFDNPDLDGYPAPGGGKDFLQGFSAGEIVGDNDTPLAFGDEGVAVGAYLEYYQDWGEYGAVPNNFGNPNGYDRSYIGFEIDLNTNGTFGDPDDGFGWVEVIVREGIEWNPNNPGVTSHADVEIRRWAYTDDGATIAAGDPGGLADSDFDYDGDVGWHRLPDLATRAWS